MWVNDMWKIQNMQWSKIDDAHLNSLLETQTNKVNKSCSKLLHIINQSLVLLLISEFHRAPTHLSCSSRGPQLHAQSVSLVLQQGSFAAQFQVDVRRERSEAEVLTEGDTMKQNELRRRSYIKSVKEKSLSKRHESSCNCFLYRKE